MYAAPQPLELPEPIPLPIRPRQGFESPRYRVSDVAPPRPLHVIPHEQSRYSSPSRRMSHPSSPLWVSNRCVRRCVSPHRARATTGPTGAIIPPIGYKGGGEWHCGVCDVTAWDEGAFQQHTDGKKHRNAMWYYNEGAMLDSDLPECIRMLQDGFYYCEFCDSKMTSVGSVQMHLSGRNHIKAEKYQSSDAQGMLLHDEDFREHYARQFYNNNIAAEFGIVPRGIAPSHWAEMLHCPLCDQTPSTWQSWSSHCTSKRHLNNVEDLSTQYYCYWINLKSGGVDYFFDLVTGLWQTQQPEELAVLRR